MKKKIRYNLFIKSVRTMKGFATFKELKEYANKVGYNIKLGVFPKCYYVTNFI